MNTSQLTGFQIECERAVRDLVEFHRCEIAGRELAGETETYVHMAIANRDIEIWIYVDEAGYRSGRKSRTIENYKGVTEARIIEALLNCLRIELQSPP